ncbi:kinase-like domain-containing protein [Mycena pura]|uniref:Kinase-like domain-containing protein n=1 Tax=Mycena pura TaxID=153505 RepID=A0AAD7E5S6_9AGAR|nr:kinase-like domain-containing protein [Mycena pura]
MKNEFTQTFLKLEHPNIVSFIDIKYVHPNLNVVMEYLEGGTVTVETMAKELGPIAEGDAREICRQLAAGLEYLHCQNPPAPIVHKDIRGANLLVTLDGCVKISDVGVPRPEVAYAQRGPGIIAWIAPEVMIGKHYTPGSDIWGVASTLIEMVEGGHPWAHEQLSPLFQARPLTSVPLSLSTNSRLLPDSRVRHVHPTFSFRRSSRPADSNFCAC